MEVGHSLSMDEDRKLEALDMPALAMGRSLFDLKEYDRCAQMLSKCHSKKAMFIRCYALFLVSNVSHSADQTSRRRHAQSTLAGFVGRRA
jgi:hypothetical protein